MRALSMDRCERILRVVGSGQPMQTTARRCAVSVKTVQRLVTQQRDTGSIASRPIPGLPRRIDAKGDAQVRERIASAPDATVLENCAWWAEVSG